MQKKEFKKLVKQVETKKLTKKERAKARALSLSPHMKSRKLSPSSRWSALRKL